jgi:hypothetical protein
MRHLAALQKTNHPREHKTFASLSLSLTGVRTSSPRKYIHIFLQPPALLILFAWEIFAPPNQMMAGNGPSVL